MFRKKGIEVILWFTEDKQKTEKRRFMAMPRVGEYVLSSPQADAYKVKAVNWCHSATNSRMNPCVLLEKAEKS